MAKDRAHDERRVAQYEKMLGKYGPELMRPSNYDHEKHKDDIIANDESMMATEGRIPASWTEK